MSSKNDLHPKSGSNQEYSSNEEPLSITEGMLADQPENDRLDFERGMSYFPPLTLILITANVVVFVWQMATGALDSEAAIIAAGALEREHLLRGEVWRLFSPMFLHGSLDHLFGNCFALYILGITCEHALGFIQSGIVYFLSGFCGSLLSIMVQPGPSVGASGAIFGLMALVVVLFYRYQKSFFIRDRRIGFVIAAWGLYTIFIGFLTPFIDNFAHIGGAIGGGIAMIFQKPTLLTKIRAPNTQNKRL
ncbi:rhomboid family intramembrane serine protease (plasmid) [Phormidium sp. CLA17]|uniref:rhomboid family intramembrane serine protease n=1 Tax=Leptolyngbya sp. Cla-17 TaxID=2803751 RepID=UPI001490FA14|nr:rhomboid family intramembrane serine protease [Leptolyngbya sp. Cla-17]MBM0745607.1 rhomboid family intramembrane serine protease [Leptolyngbya sp. Cla-17]